MKHARWFAVVSLLALSGCIPGPDKPRADRAGGKRPQNVAINAEMRACTADLNRLSARYTILANQDFGGGCSANNAVQLLGVGVPVSNVTAIQCPMARAMTVWTQGPVQSAARAAFGERVVKVETMGAYSCRNIIGGRGTGRSEHASANAVDISAFILSDGRRISVKQGWTGDTDERGFLRSIRASACKGFNIVLSPDYNAAHHDHLHFDMGRTMKDGSAYCR
jgi:hypothetical protein